MTSFPSFSMWLKQRRKLLDLTQEQLARKVVYTTSLWQKIESGERRSSRHAGIRVCAILSIICTVCLGSSPRLY